MWNVSVYAIQYVILHGALEVSLGSVSHRDISSPPALPHVFLICESGTNGREVLSSSLMHIMSFHS